MNILNRIGIFSMLLLLSIMASPSWASIPPPPVNQKIGIPDTTFDGLTEPICRSCHGRIDPDDPGRLVKPIYLPDRHHMRVNQQIQDRSDAPFPEFAENGAYTCLVCHQTQTEPGPDLGLLVQNFRNCLNCHSSGSGWDEATVHHKTQWALERNCKHCHGAMIDNPFDGHYVPTYPVSGITPRRSNGTGEDGRGACTFCHAAGTNVDPQGDDNAFNGLAVQSNIENHHSTGVVWDPITRNPAVDNQLDPPSDPPCTLCHNFDRPFAEQLRYNCENCHGIESLHSIEAMDSSGDGQIVPGQEQPFYGHIGNVQNCYGCHLGTFGASTMLLPGYSGVAPHIDDVIDGTFSAGSESTVTIVGTAFKSTDLSGNSLPVSVVLEQGDQVVRTVTAATVSTDTVTVVLPADLPAGLYNLRVKTGSEVVSNPMPIALTPAAVIDSVTIANGVFTINGSGFSDYIAARDAGTNVSVNVRGTDVACTVDSWTGDAIVADCGSANCGVVTVNTVFDSASAQAAVCESSNRKKVRRFFME